MCDRESRDLLRSLEKKTSKKMSSVDHKVLKHQDENAENNQDSENKSILTTCPNNFLAKTTPSNGSAIRSAAKVDLFNAKINGEISKSDTFLSHDFDRSAAENMSTYKTSEPANSITKLMGETHPANTAPWKDVSYNHHKHHSDQLHSTHPVYHTISLINGTINRMDLNQMKSRCKELNLDSNGKREAVKRRLKEYYKTEKLIDAGLLERKSSDERNSDYFVVVDFEATCEEKNPPGYPHEIIEFPAVLVSAKEKKIVDVFHSFVRPTINPVLSEFCHNLTGITQDTVDTAETFGIVHKKFLKWLSDHQLGARYTYTMVTDGPFDMGRFLYLQTRHLGMPFPFSYAANWANLRKCFANFYKSDFYGGSSNNNTSNNKLPGLKTMLDMLGLEFEGTPHSGVDDARNIARILVRLLSDRAFVRINEKIVINSTSKADDDNRSAARLANVIPVARKEAEKWFRAQKKEVQNFSAASQGEDGPESNGQNS